MTNERRIWSRQELLIVFRLYCRTPFGRLHSRNPEIAHLAQVLGRTPSAVAMKACNFASLDPHQRERNITALANVSRADRVLWDNFAQNSESVAAEAEAAYAQVTKGQYVEETPELELPDTPTDTDALVKVRRVQGFFRAAVLAAYDNRCALTGLPIPELLNASHIIPWHIDATRRADPRNGLCLNALHDRAFDRGLLTFDGEFRAVLSPRIRDTVQLPLHKELLFSVEGRQLQLPKRFQPDHGALEYHRKHIFAGQFAT